MSDMQKIERSNYINYASTLRNQMGDGIIVTADGVGDLEYDVDGVKGFRQSDINLKHATDIEELKKSKTSVSFNPKDIQYDEVLKAFEFADNIDTQGFSTIIARGVIGEDGVETNELDCSAFTQENCTYIIRRKFKLTQNLTMPANTCLSFEGGCLEADEEVYILGVPVVAPILGSSSVFTNNFSVHTLGHMPIIGSNVYLDVPYNLGICQSWFTDLQVFLDNISKIIKLERTVSYAGVHMCFDDVINTSDIYNLDLCPYRSIDAKLNMTFIKMSAPILAVLGINIKFPIASSFDDWAKIVLHMVNMNIISKLDTESVVYIGYLQNSKLYAPVSIFSAMLQDSSLELGDCQVNVLNSSNSTITAATILYGNITNCTLDAMEYDQPTSAATNCHFSNSAIEKYLTDIYESAGCYFVNCTVGSNYKRLDSYTKFKVID